MLHTRKGGKQQEVIPKHRIVLGNGSGPRPTTTRKRGDPLTASTRKSRNGHNGLGTVIQTGNWPGSDKISTFTLHPRSKFIMSRYIF
jgi:hypothetical protein